MSADDVAVLVAAGAASLAAVSSLVAVVLLGRRVRELRRLVEDLRRETVPLVRDARVVIEEAATEMVRVGDGDGGFGLSARLPGLRQPRRQGPGLRHRGRCRAATTGGSLGA
jgi:hypothetical protein